MFLIDSGSKTPIQNTDDLFNSGISLAYPPECKFIFENGNETEFSKVEKNHAVCTSYDICENWAKYQKNLSILLDDKFADVNYAQVIILA
jgi:orotidine-5'-phosphate decarboxylase